MTNELPVNEPCPICELTAQTSRDFETESKTVECARCGRYRATREALAILAGNSLLDDKKITSGQKARLATVVRRATERRTHVEITLALLPRLIETATLSHYPDEVADDILLYLADSSESFGLPLPFDIATIYPLFGVVDQQSLSSVVLGMNASGLVRLDSGSPPHLTIRPSGYNRIKELRSTSKASRRAFVAMSFDPGYRPIYIDGIKPAITGVGFEPIRMDDLPHNDRIDERIIVEIRRSAFLVAEFSDPRTGVFFEAGYALGFGLPVIWTCSAAKFDEVPKHFDTRQFNHIRWEDHADLQRQLKTRLLATIPGAVDKTS